MDRAEKNWTWQDCLWGSFIRRNKSWENSKFKTLDPQIESRRCATTIKTTTWFCSSEKRMQEITVWVDVLFTFFFARADSVSLKRERERVSWGFFFSLERVEFFLLRWLSFIFLSRELLSFSCLEGVELDFLMRVLFGEKVEFLFFSLERVDFFSEWEKVFFLVSVLRFLFLW